jgi:DNA-binding PadR family transcriptional regulator
VPLNYLSRIEEVILLAVYQLHDNAYGVTIRGHVTELMEKNFSVGAIYVPLDRLTRKGFLKAHNGNPTPERGGRSKRYFHITASGLEELERIKKLHQTMWSGIHELTVPSHS